MAESLKCQWDARALQSRISDPARRRRHPAGSPDETEIAAYAAALPVDTANETAVVLGMTPELRRMALQRFARIISVDHSEQAIATYRDWIDEGDRARETVIHGNWLEIDRLTGGAVAAVLGDGVFPNLSSITMHHDLLAAIRRVLRPGGVLVTRQPTIPRGFVPAEFSADSLLAGYREGRLDAAEFGFGVRFLGHYSCCYDPSTHILDNQRIFAEVETLAAAGHYRPEELAAILRYYFNGTNLLLEQGAWESMLTGCGFDWRIQPCCGKAWYRYYLVYACHPRMS